MIGPLQMMNIPERRNSNTFKWVRKTGSTAWEEGGHAVEAVPGCRQTLKNKVDGSVTSK